MSSSIVIMSEPVTAKLNEKKAFLKCAFFSICLSASSIVVASNKADLSSDLSDHTVVIGKAGYFFSKNHIVYRSGVSLDWNNGKEIKVFFRDGSVAGFKKVPLGLGIWVPAPKSKYDFWPVLPVMDDESVEAFLYKQLFETGMTAPTDTYKLVYKGKETVSHVTTGKALNWKIYNLCSSLSSDKECLEKDTTNAITWKVIDGDIFNILPKE